MMSGPRTALVLAALISVYGSGVHASEPIALKTLTGSGNLALPSDSVGAAWMRAARALYQFQQQTVLGNQAATAEHHSFAREIGLKLTRQAKLVRSTSQIRLAIIKYVLSGGSFGVLERLLHENAFPEVELALAQGTLAYAKGDRAEAAEHLSKVNPRALTVSLGGQVALVQAMLTGQADWQTSLSLSHEARLLSPGTIVEETALRLALELAIVGGDRHQFERTAMRYLFRFPQSLYSMAVHSRMARVLVASNDAETASSLKWLSQLASALPSERRRALLLEIAELALRGGRVAVAEHAARLASEDSEGMSNKDRAQLLAIQGAAMLFGPRRDQAMQLLQVANGVHSSGEVAELIAAARALLAKIEAPPFVSEQPSSRPVEGAPVNAGPAPPPSDAVPATPVHPAIRRSEETIAKAEEAISLAEKLIEEARF